MERENQKAAGIGATRAEHFKDSAMYTILDPTLDWDTVAWIRSFSKVPVILKGILAPEDARLAPSREFQTAAFKHGAATSIRFLPRSRLLPAVIEAVETDSCPSRRRYSAVPTFQALAMGAKAVLIGRPYLYGLAASGAAGVPARGRDPPRRARSFHEDLWQHLP